MSIVAPSTPGGNRSFTGRDIGASDGRRRLVEAVSSYQGPTPRLSLNALLQHESIEFVSCFHFHNLKHVMYPRTTLIYILTRVLPWPQLKENLTELLRFADQFTHQPGQDACPVNEHQLLAMIRRSRDVSTSLDKIGSLREQSMSMPFFAAAAYIPVKPMSFIARKRRQERMVCDLYSTSIYEDENTRDLVD